MRQLTPERRFAELVAADGSRPFVTYYDEATGERSELSRKSLANWVAKTRNLLGDELGLGVGDTAVVALPAHWISVPIVLGCLAAGLVINDAGDGEVGFAVPATLADAEAPADRYLVDPDRAAVGFGDAVPGGAADAGDYVTAVRPQGDTWAAVSMPASSDDVAFGGRTRGEAMNRAVERAAELGLEAGGRLLVAVGSGDAWLDTVLVPLAVGGSVVIVHNADDATLERRVTQERVTARA